MKGTKLEYYPGYTVTEKGEVYSYRQTKPKQLKPRVVSQSQKGYLQVSLYNKKCKRSKKGQLLPDQIYIHRLVWETFKGEIPEGKEIDHIDNDTRNNHIDNLQLVTRRSNMLKYNEEKWGRLTYDMIDEIREYKQQGFNIQEIADKVGKSYTTIWRVLNNKRNVRKGNKYYYEDYNYGV